MVAALLGACAEESPSPVVVLYTSADDTISRIVIDAFEAESGVRVRALGDTEATKTTGLVQRLRQEHAQGRARADVFWSSEVFLTARLAREGVLAPMDSAVAPGWPAGWRDPEGRWIGFAVRARVIVYNTDALGPADAPTRVADLASERFRGRIAVARPEFGTTRGHLAALLAEWGETTYSGWLNALADLDVILVDGNSAVVRAVASGRATVGLTDTDDVRAGRRNGWPVAMRLARDGRPGSTDPGEPLLIPNTAALVAGAPHPDEAARLIAFLVSERVERLLAESPSATAPVRPSLRAEYADRVAPIVVRTPPGVSAALDVMDRAIALARQAWGS